MDTGRSKKQITEGQDLLLHIVHVSSVSRYRTLRKLYERRLAHVLRGGGAASRRWKRKVMREPEADEECHTTSGASSSLSASPFEARSRPLPPATGGARSHVGGVRERTQADTYVLKMPTTY
jgi:hypothetical protein